MSGPSPSAQIGRAISRNEEPPQDETRAVAPAHVLAGAMLMVGALSMAVGVALISVPIALVVGGLMLMSAALIVARVGS